MKKQLSLTHLFLPTPLLLLLAYLVVESLSRRSLWTPQALSPSRWMTLFSLRFWFSRCSRQSLPLVMAPHSVLWLQRLVPLTTWSPTVVPSFHTSPVKASTPGWVTIPLLPSWVVQRRLSLSAQQPMPSYPQCSPCPRPSGPPLQSPGASLPVGVWFLGESQDWHARVLPERGLDS